LSPGDTNKPRRGPIPIPLAPASGAGLGGAVIASAVLARRRRTGLVSGSQDPLFVYVPGHGGDPQGFDDLAQRIGVDGDDVRVFDYRWAWPSDDPIEASQRATADDAADALSAYLAALGADGRPIYLVGHSKGGAVITEVVGRWDEHPTVGVAAVVGAAILDPPISSGPLGLLQSLGWLHGNTADDGLFHPVRCGWTGCRDVRDGLGRKSGVEVVIVRNPDAGFTNFRDRPDGVRVYDLDDGGGGLLGRFPNIFAMWGRMGEAHNSVLHNDTVAACIAAEAKRVGSCRWPTSNPTETLRSGRRLDEGTVKRQQSARDAGRHGRRASRTPWRRGSGASGMLGGR
jgi:pimeloyl-ACP methyl ester carboxylesterase